MTTGTGFPVEMKSLALLRAVMATRLPRTVPAALPVLRVLPLPAPDSFSGSRKHWSFSLFLPSHPLSGKKAAAELLPAAVWSGFFLRKKGVMTSAVISAVSPSPEKRQNRILTALTISRTATDFHSRKSFSFWNRWNTGIPQRYRN